MAHYTVIIYDGKEQVWHGTVTSWLHWDRKKTTMTIKATPKKR